jgi:hypothetical protein
MFSGTSDGQTKVVREGDNGVAYAWNMKEQRWDKVSKQNELLSFFLFVDCISFLLLT